MKQIEYIDITPHRSIMTKISQTGYSIEEALSELIDNSIDAKYKEEMLKIDIKISKDEIIISDSGTGMKKDTACKAIRLGFSDKKDKLGEFGLGLKTATSFLGETFELLTKSENEPAYRIVYDENAWLENGSWTNYPFEIIEDNIDRGTIVTIKNLKIKISDELIKKIKEEFGLRFGPFIKNKEISLIFNGEECLEYKPNILTETKQEINFQIGDIKVTGWWAYQLAGSNRNYYGFSTFRRGRLVTTYDKIGISPNEQIKQIIGELDIIGIPISHDKKAFIKSSDGFKEFEKYMRNYFKDKEPNLKRLLSGYPACPGIVVGTVRQVNMFMGNDIQSELVKVHKGDIIVTAMTRPQFLLAIRRAGAIVTDLGGTLCHAAICAREFNIPAVVGTGTATKVLVDGSKVIVDGARGEVYEY